MTELSAEKLAALREIAEAATGGPWSRTSDVEDTEFGTFAAYGVTPIAELRQLGDSDPAGLFAETMTGEDAEYIAAFDPPTVLALLDLIAEQQAELDVFREREAASSASRIQIEHLTPGMQHVPVVLPCRYCGRDPR